jgi:hypothetical protein
MEIRRLNKESQSYPTMCALAFRNSRHLSDNFAWHELPFRLGQISEIYAQSPEVVRDRRLTGFYEGVAMDVC